MINTDLLIRMGLYLAIIVVVLTILNLYTHGFFFKYVKVKASRGRKVMVAVRTPWNWYYVIGEPVENRVVFKDHTKAEKNVKIPDPKRIDATNEKAEKRTEDPGLKFLNSLELPDGSVQRMIGINWVFVDEATGAVFGPNLKGVTGMDLVTMDNLIKRALQKPASLNPYEKYLLIGMIILAIGLIIIYAKLGGIQESVEALKSITGANI